MKHDENKIEEIIKKDLMFGVDTFTQEEQTIEIAKKYAEHMVQQVLQKIIDIEESPSQFNADPERPLKHVYQNQGYTTAVLDIIKSINQE